MTKGFPLNPMARVPLLVTGLPVMERNGAPVVEAATLVTVPAEGVDQAGAPETIVRTCPLLPTLPKPVPPLATGRAIPLYPIARFVLALPVTVVLRKEGELAVRV